MNLSQNSKTSKTFASVDDVWKTHSNVLTSQLAIKLIVLIKHVVQCIIFVLGFVSGSSVCSLKY